MRDDRHDRKASEVLHIAHEALGQRDPRENPGCTPDSGGGIGEPQCEKERCEEAEEEQDDHRHEGAEPSTGAGAGEPESHVIRSYGGMLLFDFIAPGTALVIEQPWLRVMDLFPPALYKHRFGT